MASKQPFKVFDFKQKLAKWSLRLNKIIKHKVLSKSRNALLIGCEETMKGSSAQFNAKLKNELKKTWDIFEVSVPNFQDVQKIKDYELSYAGRQYDAIIVSPQDNKKLKNFHKLADEQFPYDMQSYQSHLLKNIFAYRLAHKYLSTSGVLILSNSQLDFAKVERKDGTPLVEQPTMKNILDAQVSYLEVTIGDRDYTDLNSCSVMGLSEQFLNTEYEDYVVKMYSSWADGKDLPMPGSFALFKMNEEGKTKPFVQYL